MCLYYEVSIRRASGGYEARPINGDGWESESDLIAEMRSYEERLIEIPSADADAMAIEEPAIRLPPGVPGISRLFAVVSDEDGADEVVGYVGIVRGGES